MFNVLQILSDISNNNYLLFAINVLSFTSKFFITLFCLNYCFKTAINRIPLLLFSIFLIGLLINDLCYIFSIFLRGILKIYDPVPSLTVLVIFDWSIYISIFQALYLFFEYLLKKRFTFGISHIAHGLINVSISSVFFYYTFYPLEITPDRVGYHVIVALIHYVYYYLPLLFIQFFYMVMKKKQANEVPKILANQLRYLKIFFIPFLLLEILSNIGVMTFPWLFQHRFFMFTLNTLVSSSAMFFVSKKIMGLRFLNIRQNVESHEKFNFLTQFNDILEQLSYATALKELAHLTQTFFHTAFAIPLGRTRLYIRKEGITSKESNYYDLANVAIHVEKFLNRTENQQIVQSLMSTKIFIRDEIEFTHFYENDVQSKQALLFLDEINADIFLPIYERNTVSAYVIIERDSRPHTLFTNKERDEMLVFTSYLSNIINILKYSNIEALHLQQKELSDELYIKQQEVNQYKECIRSFLRSEKERKIGIVFYKHRRFTIANEAAQELINMDLNNNLGHVLAQTFHDVARKVLEFKSSQSSTSSDKHGNTIIITGLPSFEEHSTILLIYYPEISDIIRTQLDQLKDPASWDLMLYVETTKAGRAIKQLLPLATAHDDKRAEQLMSFKLKLMSAALSKKTLLIQVASEDLLPIVETVHTISGRQIIHTMKLSSHERNDEYAIKLFGLNPLFQNDSPQALLEKLDAVGTLFINHIEYLSVETQNQLAQFIAANSYVPHKSDHKKLSDIRLICSSTKDLTLLVKEGLFSKALYDELQKNMISLPSLQYLADEEIESLAQGIIEQMIKTQTYKNLLSLSDKDKKKLLSDRPESIYHFKEKIHQLLQQKSTKHNIQEADQFDPAYNITDQDIAAAVRMGKKALKDPQIMTFLWNKFKNQNKIATLLGVNRSSVNRRCQEFNLR